MKLGVVFYALFGLYTVSALECKKVIPRDNVRKMSSNKLNKYFNAIKKLNSGPRPTAWDKFAKKHVTYYDKVHGNPQFLVWHRLFLHEVEEKLREIDSEIRIPYWDWTVYNSNMNDDPIWKNFGKWGANNSGKCVRQGAFSNFKVLYDDDAKSGGRCLKRSSRFDDSFGGNKDLINKYISKKSDFEFGDDLEGLPHALIHNGIGEEFSGHASPADPLFFSHHAFVDKIWFDRQKRLPQTAKRYALSDKTKVFGYSMKVSDSYNISSLCYTYTEDNFKWKVKSKIQSLSVLSAQIKPYVPLPDSASDAEKQEHALKYITEGIVASDVNNGPKQCADGSKTKPVGKILDIKYLHKMKYDESKSRTRQREAALDISEANKGCLGQ